MIRWALLLCLLLPAKRVCAEPVAAPRLVVGIYDDLIPQENISRAKKALSKLIELVGRQVNLPTELQIIPGGTQVAMTRAAQRMERGEIHLMAVTSLEFAWWLGLQHGRAEVLVLCDPGTQVNQYQELIVRRDGKFHRPVDLNGASLSIYPRMPPELLIYLKQLQAQDAHVLAGPREVVPHGAAALHAVVDGKIDAAIVDVYTELRYANAYPGRMKKLEVIDRSPSYPLPVVAGNRTLIERLRPGLWKSLQSTLKRINQQPDATAFLEVWQQRGFIDSTPTYEERAVAAAIIYPFNALPIGH